jgi:hypothetical protein
VVVTLRAWWWRWRCWVSDAGQVVMSEAWQKERDSIKARVEFHGPSIRWPIQKIANDAGAFNRARERRRKRA